MNATRSTLVTEDQPITEDAEIARLRAELASAKADSAMLDWQPIETAPKGGKSILVHCEERRNAYTVIWRDDQWQHFGGYGRLYEDPTHWMPLPKAPAIAAAMKGAQQ